MIKFEIIEGVGKITLNRPEKYHSFIREMALQLQETLEQCRENDIYSFKFGNSEIARSKILRFICSVLGTYSPHEVPANQLPLPCVT